MEEDNHIMPAATEERHEVQIEKKKKKSLDNKQEKEFLIRLSYNLFPFYVKDTIDPILNRA